MNDAAHEDLATLTRKQSLHATVIHACPSCGAPGVFHAVQGVNVGCYDPMKVGQPVGPICPNCQAVRDPDKDLGEVWKREYRRK